MLTPRTGYSGEARTLTKLLDAICIQKCAQHEVTILKHDTIGPFFFKDDQSNALTVTKECQISVPDSSRESSRTLMRKNSGSNMIVCLLTLLMLLWHGSERFGEHFISYKAAVEWAPHLPDLHSRFLYLMVLQGQHLPGQPSYHYCIEGSHH